MAEEVIGLLFGVEGGGAIDGASGKQIVDDLTSIVNTINKGNTVPKIKFHFDTTEASKAVDDLKKKLKDIEKVASIKVTYSNGGKGGKGSGGGGVTQEIKKEMSEVLALQKKISGTKVKLGKLEMEGGNANQIAEYTSQLERLEEQYAQMMQTFMKKVTGNAGDIMFGDIKTFANQYDNLEQIAENTLAVAQAKDADAKASSAQKQKYEELSAAIQQWIKDSKTAAKIASEYSGVYRDEKTGKLTAGAKAAPGYKETIKSINETVQAVSKLRFEYATLADVQAGLANNEGDLMLPKASELDAVASSLGITTEQYKLLFNEMQSGAAKAAQNVENANRKNQQSWTATASKIRDEVQRMYDTIAKDPNARKMADEIIRYSKSATGSVGELKNKYDELRNAIHKSGADIETWGDKFRKTFAGKVRSALAATIMATFTKYLREVYTSIVDIDKAVVNLQIATGKSRSEVQELIKDYAKLGKQLGATTTEVAEGADTWLRQGYSIEDANTLIANSTMLSKLGQMEAADAATALTSAMKGYNVTVEDSIRIIDKFTAVDMAAAASAGDIATAMSETATSARIAGVSMDRLIGYIATVKEVTQDGAESVGTFYKTLFARMNNVAAGKFIDEETGESLNDVETVLNELGIKLRDVNGEFRNSGEVLDEVAERWNTFDNVAQHAIATAFAGTRQQEKFTTLMEHYGEAMEYAEIATGSAGTAVEKYNAWIEGIEGKLNTLKATFQELAMAILDSELITGAFDFVTWLLEALTNIIDAIGGLNTVLYTTVAIVAILKANSIVTFIMSICTAVTKLIGFIASLVTSFQIAKAQGISLGQYLKNAFYQITAGATTAQLAVAAFVAVISVALIAVNLYNSSVQESINNSLNAANAANQEGKEYLDTAKSLKELVDEYEALAEASEGGVFDNEAAEKVRSIQNKITDLVGDQADNLDLVNGKLDDEIRKMRELATGAGGAVDNAIKQGNTQIAEATNAYEKMVGSAFASDYLIIGEALTSHLWGAWETGGVTDFTKEWTDQFNVELQKHKLFSEGFGMEKGYGYGFKTEFDTIEEFAKQYEGISAMYKELSAEHGDSELFKTASTFLADYKSIYETYMSGKLLIEEANKVKDEVNDLFAKPEDNGVTVALKSAYEILEEVQDGYDGLASALTDVTSEGYLTADALATLFKLEKDNALAGLKLADILTQDANGYKLAKDALQKYVQALISAYTVEGAFASQKDKENAIANLENLRSVLATLMATQEESTDANKAYREELEKEQDMYEDQLDKFEELIDLRKDLLQTYKKELDYQKELEKRQRNVTALQTKLSVARLDQSAAGQARVRELEAELKSAQEDLEDFTLEHAIDVLTDQLESTNAEWKAIIQGKLDKITRLLEGLDNTPDVNVNVDTSWMQSAMSAIAGAIEKIGGGGVVDNPGGTGETGGGTLGTYDQWSEYWYSQNPGAYGPPPPMPDGWTLATSYSTVQEYRNAIQRLTDDMVADNKANGRSEAYAVSSQQWQARYRGAMSTSDIATAKTAYEWLRSYYTSITGKVPNYHTGGLVGGIATLPSSEEFAKLLKGEFVSTPAQMKRFMEETLPKIANYSATGGTNEFNAPLIEITCESVTTEALPELEHIVNEAVKEIKRELDSGMSRTGFKRPKTKRLT